MNAIQQKQMNNQENINIIINDGMSKNIVVTILNFILCCCSFVNIAGFITGLIGIYHSNQVRSKLLVGDQIGAQSAANTANLMGNISIGILLFGFIIYIILVMVYGIVLFDELLYYY